MEAKEIQAAIESLQIPAEKALEICASGGRASGISLLVRAGLWLVIITVLHLILRKKFNKHEPENYWFSIVCLAIVGFVVIVLPISFAVEHMLAPEYFGIKSLLGK